VSAGTAAVFFNNLGAKSFFITHRLHAWGVLGLATGGFFSLLTLLFSGAISQQTPRRKQSFAGQEIFSVR